MYTSPIDTKRPAAPLIAILRPGHPVTGRLRPKKAAPPCNVNAAARRQFPSGSLGSATAACSLQHNSQWRYAIALITTRPFSSFQVRFHSLAQGRLESQWEFHELGKYFSCPFQVQEFCKISSKGLAFWGGVCYNIYEYPKKEEPQYGESQTWHPHEFCRFHLPC